MVFNLFLTMQHSMHFTHCRWLKLGAELSGGTKKLVNVFIEEGRGWEGNPRRQVSEINEAWKAEIPGMSP